MRAPSWDGRGARARLRAGLVALLLVLVVVGDALLVGVPVAEQALFGVTEAAVALVAGLACLRVGRQLDDLGALSARRQSWVLMGAACLCWTAGQVVWAWREVVRGDAAPFPSVADAGFMGFAVLSVVSALYVHRGYGTWRLRLRTLADGLVMACALFCTAWVLSLDAMVATAEEVVPLLFSLAYPVTDIVLLTVLLLSLLRNPRSVPARLLVAGGALMLAGDAGFTYDFSLDGYATGGASDYAWLGAFALFGLAAAARHDDPRGDPVPEGRSRLSVLLPYVPLLLAAPMVVWQLWTTVDRVVVVASAVLVCLVLGRQWLILAENHTLLEVTQRQRAELQRLAHYDGLTGLANRGLFADRMRRAVDESVASGVPVTVAFVDLDDFKGVNDTLGHAVGDALLREVGTRLSRCLPSGGTAARLGGDEFAVVVTDPAVDRDLLVGCILGSLAEPFAVGAAVLPLTASVGAVSEVVGIADEQTVDLLLALADTRMYDAKRAAARSAALD
ncbi:diguanylate cyclase (GGDEF)-like protein [Kineococcus xinjiangensis]|uniref:Diguanylate cyclase (GGDEF)-like protein n=1 Tax=Kineococcus xinjiangensis TaxID=512762 RepID=A0A2S6IG18_9ACTN|nr:GGDEF domain-containing protein [Kineococcus xinjiangensis]PPK93100.1 diguanylate cyclase (GGDEF)-like protein [Kineococcus xinjiangensis]